MPFDAQKVGKFLKNFEDKNILSNLDGNGGRLRGLILELTTKYHLDITTDGYITGRRSLDQDGNQYPIINLVFKHPNRNKTKSYHAVIP